MQLEGRDTQYRAALRKKDGDYAKLQESMRRAAQKESRSSSTRGIETTFELTPATRTGNGNAPLGGLMNEHSRRRTEELEKENASLRSMLVDLQVSLDGPLSFSRRGGKGMVVLQLDGLVCLLTSTSTYDGFMWGCRGSVRVGYINEYVTMSSDGSMGRVYICTGASLCLYVRYAMEVYQGEFLSLPDRYGRVDGRCKTKKLSVSSSRTSSVMSIS